MSFAENRLSLATWDSICITVVPSAVGAATTFSLTGRPGERWTTGARPRRNILLELERDAKQIEGDPREILLGPSADPYQSDEAARLTRKALLILEQYRLRVQVLTLCGKRSTRDFDILARNRWKYGTVMYFQSEKLREEWEPGGAPIAERVRALQEAHAAGISTWVKISPAVEPAELIDVVESLRADVDAWRIGTPPPGERPPKPTVGGRPRFVDADTALTFLRGMVERGVSDKLPRADQMKIWSPGETAKGNGGKPQTSADD